MSNNEQDRFMEPEIQDYELDLRQLMEDRIKIGRANEEMALPLSTLPTGLQVPNPETVWEDKSTKPPRILSGVESTMLAGFTVAASATAVVGLCKAVKRGMKHVR